MHNSPGNKEYRNKDISEGYFPKFLHKIVCCDPSFVLSQGDGSNEGSQHTFMLQNKKNCL